MPSKEGTQTNNPGNQGHEFPSIRTMQDDLASVQPEPFPLRHRQPLPKSERMEDLRATPRVDEINSEPQPHDFTPNLLIPNKGAPRQTNPAVWITIGVLSLIFLAILTALLVI